MRVYHFEGTLNSRDLGGYKTIDGKKTKYLRFIRSDSLRYISKEDICFLRDNHFVMQIDFRTEEIKNQFPSILENDKNFKYVNIPLKEGSYRSLKENDSIPSLYLRMVSNEEAIAKIFKEIALVEGGIILSCTAGKDRTGIISYLLLSLANVSKDDIISDYVASEELINQNIEEVRKKYHSYLKPLGDSKKEYLEEFISLFNNKYIDTYHYLKKIGLSDEELDKIKSSLVR